MNVPSFLHFRHYQITHPVAGRIRLEMRCLKWYCLISVFLYSLVYFYTCQGLELLNFVAAERFVEFLAIR